jgi:mitochondrial fission protein ELM1
LILSAGRRSAAAARWLKDHFNGVPKTVQILDCGLAPRHFDWIIVPEHDRVEGPNVIRTIGSLNPVDSSWIRKSAAAHGGFDCGPEGNAVPCVTLLLGGPGRRFSFSRRWFRSSFRAICSRVEEQGGQVIVVESSRTPGWAAQAMADSRGRCPVRRVPWVVSDPAGSETAYASALDMADALVVSADSVNLLSEACASGKPVFLAGLAQTSGKKSRFCNRLIDEGYALNLEQAGALEQLSNEKIPATRLLRETREVARQLIDSGLLG